MPRGGQRALLDGVRVSGGLQLGLHPGGEPVAGADRGDQRGGREFGERGVGVGVAHECGQMGLVGHLAAERHGEAQSGARRLAEPGGEQRGGRGALGERGQRYVGAVAGLEGRVGGGFLEDAVVVEGLFAGLHPVALPQQRSGLYEAQRQSLGLEPEVARPVRLVLAQDASDGALQQFEAAAAVEAAEEDLVELGLGGRGRDVGSDGDHEGALGGGVEQHVEGAAADLRVVEDDDRPDLADEPVQFLVVRAVQGAS